MSRLRASSPGAFVRGIRSFGVGLALVAGNAFAQVDPHAGEDFLRLVDAHKYGEAWDASSDYMKSSVSRGEFTTQMVKTRETIGDMASRKLRDAKPETDPKGAPPGEYLLMTYDTVFASQGAPKTETLPLIKGADGKWRAVGYFVR